MEAEGAPRSKASGVAGFLSSFSAEFFAPLFAVFLAAALPAPAMAIALAEGFGAFLSGASALLNEKRRRLLAILPAVAKAGLLAAPVWQAVGASRMADLIGDGERKERWNRSRASGYMEQTLSLLGAVSGALACSIALAAPWGSEYRGFSALFIVSFVPACLAGLIALFFVRRGEAGPDAEGIPRQNLPFALSICVFLAGQFSILLLLLRAMDFLSLSALPLAYLAYVVFLCVCGMPASILASKAGAKPTMLFGMCLLLLALTATAYYPSAGVFFAAFALIGIETAIIREISPRFFGGGIAGSGTGFSRQAPVLSGVMSLFANIAAGALWQSAVFGAPASFAFSIATTISGMVLLLLVVKD